MDSESRLLGLSQVPALEELTYSLLRQPCEDAVIISFTREYGSPGQLGGSLSHRAAKYQSQDSNEAAE